MCKTTTWFYACNCIAPPLGPTTTRCQSWSPNHETKACKPADVTTETIWLESDCDAHCNGAWGDQEERDEAERRKERADNYIYHGRLANDHEDSAEFLYWRGVARRGRGAYAHRRWKQYPARRK